MIHFRNDYSAGAHPTVLDALVKTNLELTAGYGCDPYCQEAADMIRDLCEAPDAEVHFLVGGTQTNKTVIGAALRPYEAVIAAHTGHICVHETGAIENNGHKVIHCPSPDGKVTPEMIESVMNSHSSEHMVVPRLVYISNTTEVGTVYTRSELSALHIVCDKFGLLLYCDGARLGSAMTIKGADTTFKDYADFCDAFTIGGTKNGLLFGEALVITDLSMRQGFRHCMKQQGAILAKGRLLGVQFRAILKDDLYLSLASHANRLAERLTDGLTGMNISLLAQSPSNQVFPILPDRLLEKLQENFTFTEQERVDASHRAVRFCTSWATSVEAVNALCDELRKLS